MKQPEPYDQDDDEMSMPPRAYESWEDLTRWTVACEPLHPVRVFVEGTEYCDEPQCWGEKGHDRKHANRHGYWE